MDRRPAKVQPTESFVFGNLCAYLKKIIDKKFRLFPQEEEGILFLKIEIILLFYHRFPSPNIDQHDLQLFFSNSYNESITITLVISCSRIQGVMLYCYKRDDLATNNVSYTKFKFLFNFYSIRIFSRFPFWHIINCVK